MFITQYSNVSPQLENNVNFLQNASYDFIGDKIDCGIHVIRNPLDIIVSAYHSHKKTHPLDGWPELAAQRAVLCGADEHDGMFLTLAFLERDDFDSGVVGPLHALRHWNYGDERFVTLRMEDIVRNPTEALGAALQAQSPGGRLPDPERHTFQAVAGRPPGEVDNHSHYRSGKPDQWRTSLPAAVIAYMRAHYEPLLKQFYPDSLGSKPNY